MNYLALDYGEHRVGVAFADSELRMAFSRETIDQKITNLFVRLDELVKIYSRIFSIGGRHNLTKDTYVGPALWNDLEKMLSIFLEIRH